MEPVFLSLDEVLEIHDEQIERYGGSGGLGKRGRIEIFELKCRPIVEDL
jgi:hypothetical protein